MLKRGTKNCVFRKKMFYAFRKETAEREWKLLGLERQYFMHLEKNR